MNREEGGDSEGVPNGCVDFVYLSLTNLMSLACPGIKRHVLHVCAQIHTPHMSDEALLLAIDHDLWSITTMEPPTSYCNPFRPGFLVDAAHLTTYLGKPANRHNVRFHGMKRMPQHQKREWMWTSRSKGKRIGAVATSFCYPNLK